MAKGTWAFIRKAVKFGRSAAHLLFRLTKFTLELIPDIIKGIYRATKYVLRNLLAIIKGIYKASKNIIKTVFNSIFAMVKWLTRSIPNIVSTTLGIVLGVAYGVIQLMLDATRSIGNIVIGKTPAHRHSSQMNNLPESRSIKHALTKSKSSHEKTITHQVNGVRSNANSKAKNCSKAAPASRARLKA